MVAYKGRPSALQLAAALEKHVAHPIARAIAEECKDEMLPQVGLSAIRDVPGKGVSGIVAGLEVMVGKPAWVEAHVDLPNSGVDEHLATYLEQGLTPVAVAVNGAWAGLIGLSDPLRNDTASTLAALQQEGHSQLILSGDHTAIARKIGQKLGLSDEQVAGHVTPEEKRKRVEALNQVGPTVMIGDGVNDAEALKHADVGIAVAGSTAASQVSADVFLTRGGLRPLENLIQSSKQVMRVIHVNLWFAVLYNAVGAAAAMAGLVHPLVAAIAMPLSSLILVVHTLGQHTFAPSS